VTLFARPLTAANDDRVIDCWSGACADAMAAAQPHAITTRTIRRRSPHSGVLIWCFSISYAQCAVEQAHGWLG
jgi:hypothetical protein